ncbi:MAG: hypothetical protein AAF962_26625 [Actinomycetota bacterium]
MHRLSTLLLALALLGAACGSGDDVVSGAAVAQPAATGEDPGADPEEPTDEEPEGPAVDQSTTTTTTVTTAPPTTTTTTTVETTTTTEEPPAEPGPYPVGELAVDIELPFGGSQAYTISCTGDTASLRGEVDLPAEAMCLRLADPSVQDLLINGFPPDQACTLQFGSEHQARFTGSLDGERVDFSVNRFDGCGISAWDGTLADVLPDADL